MKAITLTQPWATLVAIGAKHYETRSWAPPFPSGILAIHAGKGIPKELGGEKGHLRRCAEEPFASVLAAAGYTALNLPRGEVIAITQVHGCFTTNSFRPEMVAEGWVDPWGANGERWKVEPAEHEAAFGNYGPDRVAWALGGVIDLLVSSEWRYPCRGRQKVWNLPDKIADELNERMNMAAFLL
jgi:hypothetical protein